MYQIEEWVSGKENNIRGLLSTLQDVLWPGATWAPLSIGEVINMINFNYLNLQLLDNRKLKKSYQQACLLVHPDRVCCPNSFCLTLRRVRVRLTKTLQTTFL